MNFYKYTYIYVYIYIYRVVELEGINVSLESQLRGKYKVSFEINFM